MSKAVLVALLKTWLEILDQIPEGKKKSLYIVEILRKFLNNLQG